MKKIIVFFNSEPAVVVPAMTGVNTIMREYPNGEKTHLTVMAAGFPSLTGDHKVIYVAADRHVTSEEILEAAIRLLQATTLSPFPSNTTVSDENVTMLNSFLSGIVLLK